MQPWKREQHVQRPWGEKLPAIFEEPQRIRERSPRLLLYLYTYFLSLGEDQGQQSQSPEEEGLLDGEPNESVH